MKSITEQVQELNSAKAIEAAKFVASSIAEEPTITESEFEHEFGDPLTHINDMDRFARIILINAAEDHKYEALVQNAINNSGKKQLVLGGAEIIALGIIGIAALKIILNPKSEEEFEYQDENGKKVKHKVKYNNDTSFLTSILKKYFSS